MRELKLDLISLRAAFYSTQVKSGWFKLPVTFRSVNPNGRTNYDLPCAWFGSLWQATHASLQDTRILALVQEITEPNKSESWEVTPTRKSRRS